MERAGTRGFIDFIIAANPEAGDVIPETGGVRKVRWAQAGTGKRGGAGVIYFYHDADRPLYLLLVYARARREVCPWTRRERCASSRPCSRGERERNDVMGKFGKELIESLAQAAAHAEGRRVKGVRVTKVEIPDVRAIRRSLRMSQHRFAAAYRIPLPTLKNWEQGRRAPDAPALAYLLAIKRRPKEIMEAVS